MRPDWETTINIKVEMSRYLFIVTMTGVGTNETIVVTGEKKPALRNGKQEYRMGWENDPQASWHIQQNKPVYQELISFGGTMERQTAIRKTIALMMGDKPEWKPDLTLLSP